MCVDNSGANSDEKCLDFWPSWSNNSRKKKKNDSIKAKMKKILLRGKETK